MLRLILALPLIALAQPLWATTVTQTQIFTGSFSNVFTRSIEETYIVPFEAEQDVTRVETFSVDDFTAPKGTFEYFNASLGTLEKVVLRYERVGGNDDRVHLRSSGCSATVTGNCDVDVLVRADVRYGVQVTPGDTIDIWSRGSTGSSMQLLTSFISLPEPTPVQKTSLFSEKNGFIGTGVFFRHTLFRSGHEP